MDVRTLTHSMSASCVDCAFFDRFDTMGPESMTRSFQPSDFIRHCTLAGRVVVLDLRVGKYLIFDAIASLMWNLLLSVPDHKTRVDQLANHYKITCSRCEFDFDVFIESCKKREFLRNNT